MVSSNSLFPTEAIDASRATPAASSNPIGDFDISHYFRLILGHKWKILVVTFVVIAIVAIQVQPMRAIYSANTTILIDTGRFQNTQGVFGDAGGRNYLQTQFGLLSSRAFIEKVVDRLDLTKHPEYDPRQAVPQLTLFQQLTQKIVGVFVKEEIEEPVYDDAFETQLSRNVVRAVKASLTIEPIFGTQLMKITSQTHNRDLSASIANELAEVYIESYLEANLEAAKKSAAWLSGRLSELQNNLQVAEDELLSYRESENLVDVQGITTLDAAELSQLRTNFVRARQERITSENIAEQVNRVSQSDPLQLLSVLEIASNPAIQKLQIDNDSAEKKLSDLSRTYGNRHPLMVAAREDKNKATERLVTRLQTAAKSITDNYKRDLATERQMSSEIRKAQGRLQSLGRKEVKLRELERKVEINRQVYELMLSRGKEADSSVSFEDSPARIIDAALPPKYSIGPNKKKFVLMGAVAAVMLSIGVIVLLDLFDATIRVPDEVESLLKVPLLGFLPLLKNRNNDEALRAFSADKQNRGFGESIRSIRTSLVLSSLENPFKTILITSSLPNEGKSTVALNIAEALGQMEKVLLIDADLRKPSIAKNLKLPATTVGLSNIILGKAKVEDAIVPSKEAGIDVLAAGIIPDRPLELLSSPAFKDTLEILKASYDRIIVDAPPSYVVSDAQVLSKISDALIYVVKSNSTSKGVALKGINGLKKIGAPITGVILNQLDLKKAKAYEPTVYFADGDEAYGYGYNYQKQKS